MNDDNLTLTLILGIAAIVALCICGIHFRSTWRDVEMARAGMTQIQKQGTNETMWARPDSTSTIPVRMR